MINIEEKELKPCPFCGWTKLRISQKTRYSKVVYFVLCNKCHARGGTCSVDTYRKEEEHDKTKCEAIRKWNERI